jgi:hypothetical protein
MKTAKDWFGAMLKVAAVLALVLGLSGAAVAQEKKATKKAAPTATKQQAPAKKVVDEADEGEKAITKKDVPPPVLAAFAKAYPKATVKGYAKEMEKGKTAYEVESMEGKTHRDVLFATDGQLLIVEESMDMKDVPAAVQQALEKKYPKAKVDLAEKVTEGNNVGYEFKLITAAGKKAEAKFDAKGKEEKP